MGLSLVQDDARRAGELVQTRRAAQTTHYSLADHRTRAVFETLARLYGRDADGPTPAPVVGVPDASRAAGS